MVHHNQRIVAAPHQVVCLFVWLVFNDALTLVGHKRQTVLG